MNLSFRIGLCASGEKMDLSKRQEYAHQQYAHVTSISNAQSLKYYQTRQNSMNTPIK